MEIRVLVTGASGFVAGHLIRLLLEQNYLVRGTVRSLEKKDKIMHLLDMQRQFDARLELVEADLLRPDTWPPTLVGCSIAMHTASPFIIDVVKEDDVVKPAVEGTLNVLRAIAAYNKTSPSPRLGRVVLTSSIVAICSGYDKDKSKAKYEFSEKDWSNLKECGAYAKSKTLAEQAAWEFVRSLSEEERFGLSTVNPGYVQGPLLNPHCGEGSQHVIQSLMRKVMPAVPHLSLSFVDVRDVALTHLRAATVEAAIGQRYVCASRSLWLTELSKILHDNFSQLGYDVPTKSLPNAAVWVASFWDKTAASILSTLSKETRLSNQKARSDLGINFRDVTEAVVQMGQSIIDFKLIPPPKKEPKVKPAK